MLSLSLSLSLSRFWIDGASYYVPIGNGGVCQSHEPSSTMSEEFFPSLKMSADLIQIGDEIGRYLHAPCFAHPLRRGKDQSPAKFLKFQPRFAGFGSKTLDYFPRSSLSTFSNSDSRSASAGSPILLSIQVDYLENLSTERRPWRIQVRIVRLWKQPIYTKASRLGDCMEMVVIDQRGTRMQDTINPVHVNRFRPQIEEMGIYSIHGFTMLVNTETQFKPCDNSKFQIVFPYKIIVADCNPPLNS